MNPCAAAVIAVRPTGGVPSLILSDPPSAKNEATLAAFWLHQAAVHRIANPFSFSEFMRLVCGGEAERMVSNRTMLGGLTPSLTCRTPSRDPGCATTAFTRAPPKPRRRNLGATYVPASSVQ